MNGKIRSDMIKLGIVSLLGYIIGFIIFIVLGVRENIFTTGIDKLKKWDLPAMGNLMDEHKIYLIWPLIICIFVFAITMIFFKNNKLVPLFIVMIITIFVGFYFIPFIILILAFILSLIYFIWELAQVINVFLFHYIASFFFIFIEFILNNIFSLEVRFINFNHESKHMFFQTIIFFSLLPYLFRVIVAGCEKVLNKTSGPMAVLLVKPLRLLSINFFRYMTYTFAFFTYLMSFLWVVPKNMNAMKEGLLAFIIIDVVLFGLYSYMAKKRKKTMLVKSIVLSRNLELIKNEIIRHNLLSNKNCKIKIKRSPQIKDFYEKAKKCKDKRLIMISQKIRAITYESTDDKICNRLSFQDIYMEIEKIQKLIDEYIVE
ncbi:hypothetical protein I6G82_11530 [Lysinibacillus macroides]|uniref:Uncharacterized protein n=1 Tax=Lysinibacillus macroides TaxID=33935 RepID=A0A0N0CWD4_9BACI|nr:hypothetical protein [Lysinibacillus macroides]KOY83001.1 hypothetical protein ADM90_06730 [Lysinibacillus macroides]QPR70150.1 hypothetical protein I6G82_11530 [Lysinibacillus macroides]